MMQGSKFQFDRRPLDQYIPVSTSGIDTDSVPVDFKKIKGKPLIERFLT